MLSIFSQLIFGNANLFGAGSGSSTWKDKNLCFDLRPTDLKIEHGEQLVACFFPIEDVKGNQDEWGLLKVTNLRLIWICCSKKRVNLSIGWRTVSLTFEQNFKDSLGASVTNLCVITKYESTKYEFVFNKMSTYGGISIRDAQEDWNAILQLRRFSKGDRSLSMSHLTPMHALDPFEAVFQVWQAYKRTCLFRHCRSNLTHLVALESMSQSKLTDISKLPGEDIIDVYQGIIQSESRAVKYSGTLILTNVRLIWIDESLPMRNYSIPYSRVDSLKIKQKDRVVINTHDYLSTTNQIELRAPKNSSDMQSKKTRLMLEQIQNLYTLYKSKPKFGPESCEEVINMIGQMRPLDDYFRSLDQSLENFGPEMNRAFLFNVDQLMHDKADLGRPAEGADEPKVADSETELIKYSQKLNSYLNERPIQHDRELIYSTGE